MIWRPAWSDCLTGAVVDVFELADVAVPLGAAAHGGNRKKDAEATVVRICVEMDRLVSPIAGEAEISPRTNVFRGAKLAFCPESGVELLQSKPP